MPYTPPPPPPPPSSSKVKPLGVPENYSVATTLPARSVGRAVGDVAYTPDRTAYVAPRYFDGAEYLPASLPAEKIAGIQRILAQVGLIGAKTEHRLGVWDPPTRNAYKQLLELANQQGTDEAGALDLLAQSPEVTAANGYGAPLPKTQLASPDDLHSIVDTVAKATIGKRADAAFIDRFSAAFHAQQTREAMGAASGGDYVNAPSPDTFAKEMLQQSDPAGAAEMSWLGTMQNFGKILSNGTPTA